MLTRDNSKTWGQKSDSPCISLRRRLIANAGYHSYATILFVVGQYRSLSMKECTANHTTTNSVRRRIVSVLHTALLTLPRHYHYPKQQPFGHEEHEGVGSHLDLRHRLAAGPYVSGRQSGLETRLPGSR